MAPGVERRLNLSEVAGLIQTGLQLAPVAPLRVAVVAPPISLADWQASLLAELDWGAFPMSRRRKPG